MANNVLGLWKKEGKKWFLEILSLIFCNGMIQKRVKIMLACHFILVISMPSAKIAHLALGIIFSKIMEETKCFSKMPTRRHMMEVYKIINGIATVSQGLV